MAESEAVKEARRKKIKQLEASLFNGQENDVVTGLPELQRVNEYSTKYGHAERKKTSLPSLKKQAKEVKKIFFPDPRKPAFSRLKSPGLSASDEEDLLESSGSSHSSYHPPDESGGTTPGLLPSPMSTPSLDSLQPRKKAASSTSNTILKSEVEQLDESIKQLVADPKQEILEKLRKRHGFPRSPSLDSTMKNTNSGSVANVSGRDSYLGRATLLDQDKAMGASPRRRSTSSMDKSSKLLAEEQADLDQVILKLDPSKSADGPSLAANWPIMPDIKATLPIKGSKKDSLQPLPTKTKKKKTKKRLSIGNALGFNKSTTSSSASTASPAIPIHSNPLESSLAKASRLPAIERPVPQIKVDNSNRRRRDPAKERNRNRNRLDGHSSDSSPTNGMINFDNLERPYSAGPDETFLDVPSSLDDIPNTLQDMPSKTFDEIPSNVFDAIPSAVSAREGRRLERLQKEYKAKQQQDNARTNVPPLIEKEKEEDNMDGNPSQAATIFLSQRVEDEEDQKVLSPTANEEENDEANNSNVGGSVSLIAALFPNSVATVRNNQDQMESDFMFALFIQEQEQTVSNAPNPRPSAPPPPPDPNDPDVGHFCAPFCQGFCEANFCIFHNPATTAAALDSEQ